MHRLVLLVLLLILPMGAGDALAWKLTYAMPPPESAQPLAFRLVAGPPPGASNGLGSAEFLDEEQRIFYRQEFGGGGLLAGLLLGPVGAGGNAAAIQSGTRTEGDALRGKFKFTTAGLLRPVLADAALPTEGAAVAELTPNLYVTRDKAGRLFLWTIIDVRIDTWKGRYSALATARPNAVDLAKGLDATASAQLESSLRESYGRALRVLEADTRNAVGVFVPRQAEIEGLSPRFHARVRYVYTLEKDGALLLRGLDPQTNLVAGFGFTGVLVVPSSMAVYR